MKKVNHLLFLIVLLSWIATSAFHPLPLGPSFNPAAAVSVAAAPAAFGKVLPTNAAPNQQVVGVVIKWSASDANVTYQYCLRAGKAACNGNKWVTAGSPAGAGFFAVILPTLAANTTYYWQVRAINSSNAITYADGGAWFLFYTGSGAPAAFSKISPANTLTVPQELSVTLLWEPAFNANYYDYCLDTSGACTTWNPVGNQTSVVIAGLTYGTIYYWQIRAWVYSTPTTSTTTYANTGPWRFTTKMAPPAAFNKAGPLDGAIQQPTNLTLQWNASAGASSGYTYCVSTSPSCTPAQEQPAGSSTSVIPTGLSLGTTYYWQVFASNGVDKTPANAGAWHSFTTLASAPVDFTKISPQANEIDLPLTPVLYWYVPSLPGNTTYEYCLASAAFSTTCPGGWKATSRGAIISLPNSDYPNSLAAGSTYYWQIRYSNNSGTFYADTALGGTPAPFTFTTLKAGPTITNASLNFSIPEDTVLKALLTTQSNYAATFAVLSGLPAGLVVDAQYASNGIFTYTPPANFNGQVNFQFEISDGINQPAGPYTVSIQVTAVDDPPTISPIADQFVLPGDLVITVLVATDPDLPYGDTLTFSIDEALPSGASLDATNGIFSWAIPSNQAPRTFIFTVRVTDSSLATATTRMKIIVGGYTVNIPVIRK